MLMSTKADIDHAMTPGLTDEQLAHSLRAEPHFTFSHMTIEAMVDGKQMELVEWITANGVRIGFSGELNENIHLFFETDQHKLLFLLSFPSNIFVVQVDD